MIEQRSPEWHQQRKGRITGSNAGAVLGLAPYRTRADVLRAMVRETLGAESEFIGNIATEYGTNNEDGAVIDFRLDTGVDVAPAPFVEFEDWAGVSPDGYVSDGGLIEIKCPFSLRKEATPVFKSIDEQPHYMAQVQMQLHVTGRLHCHFFQWAPGGTACEIVYYDPEYAAGMMSALKQFHAEYLDALKDPAEYLAPLWVTIDTPEAHKMVTEYDELAEAIENATARKKELLAAMVAKADSKNALFAGRKLTLTKRVGSVSYAKAKAELAPDADLEKWRGKAVEFWGLS